VEWVKVQPDPSNPFDVSERYMRVVNSPNRRQLTIPQARKTIVTAVTVIALSSPPHCRMAGKDPGAGGSALYPAKNILQSAVNSKDHTTLWLR
jgi:hypothetical protein